MNLIISFYFLLVAFLQILLFLAFHPFLAFLAFLPCLESIVIGGLICGNVAVRALRDDDDLAAEHALGRVEVALPVAHDPDVRPLFSGSLF